MSFKVTCPTPANPADGYVDTTGNGVGATATYTCNTGFILVGPFARTCDIYGAWTGHPPTCDPGNLYFDILFKVASNSGLKCLYSHVNCFKFKEISSTF